MNMDEEYQRMAANSIAHEAFCAGQAWQQAAAAQERPCVLWKPRLFRDGNQWCALLGENIQDGVVGFGDSPDAAMWAFDKAWREKLPPAPGAQPAPTELVGARKVTRDFRWDAATQCHVPTLKVEFEPVHIDEPSDAKGWQDQDRIAAMLEAATGAQPAPSVPEGWKLVPIEPTPTMITAALESSHAINAHRAEHCYRAMLAAAPEAKP
jgi:hypothetical protein